MLGGNRPVARGAFCKAVGYGGVSLPPDPTASVAAIDRVSCETYSDMLTILQNSDYAFHNNGISSQERIGWYALAFRVIGRAPSAGDGPVATALTTLKTIQPPMITESSTPDPTSRAWGGDASQTLAAACKAEGLPYWAEGSSEADP